MTHVGSLLALVALAGCSETGLQNKPTDTGHPPVATSVIGGSEDTVADTAPADTVPEDPEDTVPADTVPEDPEDTVPAEDTGEPQDTVSEALGSYLRATTSSTTLYGWTSILSVEVPAGTWLVHAKATAVNFGAADFARCLLLADGAQIDASAAMVGGTGPAVATIPTQALGTWLTPTTVELTCLHDGSASGSYVDPGAVLRLVPVEDGDVAVSAASVFPPGYGEAPVAFLPLDGGDRALFAKVTAVSFGADATVWGDLTIGAGALDASGTTVGGTTSAATVQLLSLYDIGVPDAATLGLLLGSPSGPYADPGASLISVPGDGALTAGSTTVALPDDGSAADVVSLSVPAGDWALSAKAIAVNFGVADFVRCALLQDGVQIDASTTYVGTGGSAMADLQVLGLSSLAQPATVSLSCSHDGAQAGPYMEAGAVLLALPTTPPAP